MTVDTEQLYFILENTPAEQNIMLVGRHGIGKSRILEEYYTGKGFKVVTLFLGQMSDPGDLIGLPEKDEKTGKTDFLLPYWFPTDRKPVVLFLDELNRARPEVLQTIMDLTLNRKLAGKALPMGSRIISAVNNGNEYQLTDLDPALVSRFNIYEFAPSVENWLDWAENSGIDSRIIDFIRENPEFLDSDASYAEAANLERTPDRRSWERASDVIRKFPELSDIHKPILTGIIGTRGTGMFFRFLKEHDIPSASEILFGNFEDVSSRLEKLSAPLLSTVNASLFRLVEKGFEKDGLGTQAAKNLPAYFNFLGTKGQKEVQAHFINLCSAESFPETLVFISTECPELYRAMTDFIMDS
ncbi:MAG: AAA family ATPase [Treponema sp.]|nr:AAA family ATPase [Treponema sp.]